MTLRAAAGDPRASTGRSGRGEWFAGYAFIAVPMLLFLVLNIGSIVYSAYISVFQWNILDSTIAPSEPNTTPIMPPVRHRTSASTRN